MKNRSAMEWAEIARSRSLTSEELSFIMVGLDYYDERRQAYFRERYKANTPEAKKKLDKEERKAQYKAKSQGGRE